MYKITFELKPKIVYKDRDSKGTRMVMDGEDEKFRLKFPICTNQGVAFLRRHQVMSTDAKLNTYVLGTWRETRR